MFKDFDFSQLENMFSQMQEKAQAMQEELQNKVFSASSGAGMVNVSVNGKFQVVDINIDDDLLKDKSAMQILLISALNEALEKASDNTKNLASEALFGQGR